MPCWGLKPVHRGSLFLKVQARKDIIPSVRGAKANPGSRPLPLSLAVRGRRARPCEDLPQSQAESNPPGHRQSRTRPPSGRWVTGTILSTTPGPPLTPQLGQVPALLADTHPAAAAPVRCCRCLALTPVLFPRGVRAGAASPPDPPSGARRAGPGYGESCHRPLSSLLPPPFVRPLPLRPASYFLDPVSARARQANRRLHGSRRVPSLARHKDGTTRDCRGGSREASPQQLEAGGPRERRSIRVA